MHIVKQENGVVKFTSMKGKYTERTFSGNARIDYTSDGVFEVSDCGKILTSFDFSEVESIQVEPAAATTPANAAALLTELQTNFFFELVSADSVVVTIPNNPNDGGIYFDTTTGILKVWNGTFWQGAQVEVEDFIYPNGDAITFLGNVASGGSSAAVTATPAVGIADLNSATLKTRFGSHLLSVNTTASAFAAFFNSSAINAPRYNLVAAGGFYIGFEWRLSAPATAINFANDPVLACAGLLTYTATTVVNPLTGIYFRMPRLGETAFVKYVVREGGAETVADTTVPVTTNVIGFLKTALLWDGNNNTMYFIAGANGTYSTKSISNFSATYPSAFAALHHGTIYVARNGAGAVPATTSIVIDKAERYAFNNYKIYI